MKTELKAMSRPSSRAASTPATDSPATLPPTTPRNTAASALTNDTDDSKWFIMKEEFEVSPFLSLNRHNRNVLLLISKSTIFVMYKALPSDTECD